MRAYASIFLGSFITIVLGCSGSHETCPDGVCADAAVSDMRVTSDMASDADMSLPLDASCLSHAVDVHRAEATECDHSRPPGTTPTAGPPAGCTTDAECTEGINGRCTGNGHDGWNCSYDACFLDSECAGGGVCSCDGESRSGSNVCATGNCQTDSDCSVGYCSPTLGSCGHYTGPVGWYCHTCEDTCLNDSDCVSASGASGYCAFDPLLAHWACSTNECVG